MEPVKKEKNQLPDGVTTEQVKGWKDRYGQDKVKRAMLFNNEGDEVKEIVIRVPGRVERNEFEKWIDKNPGKAKEVLINSCVLSGKDEVKKDDDMFEGAFDAIIKVLRISTAVIKNL